MDKQTLADNWHIQPLEQFQQGNYSLPPTKDWLPTSVPSHWQQQTELATHAGKVVYHCQFHVANDDVHTAALPRPVRTWLRFNGVFYWTQPYLNGADLGKHEGYFEPYEREVSNLLQAENSLLVEVDCPDEQDTFGKRMITGVFSHWDCLDPQANPGGIWLPVELHHSGPVHVQSVRCHCTTSNERFAQLQYAVDLDALHAEQVMLRWIITPHTFAGATQTIEQRHRIPKAGANTLRGMLKVRDPHLWWTHDLGNPDLYHVSVEVVNADGATSDATSFLFGIRQFAFRDWIPYLNGVRFFIKGNNYGPGDMRIASMTRERYEQDMQLARDCHMNFLRVHAHVEHPAFYDAANAAGILLWQDMPLQWLYHAKVMPEALRQARAMVRLLYNHPSIIAWCMHNEPIFVNDTANEQLSFRIRTYQTVLGFSWNRDILDARLKRAAEEEDTSRPVIRSSGEFSIPRLREGTDAHMYFGWYSAYGSLQDSEWFRKFLPKNLRFVTEFGAQSFPNVESCLKFLPADVSQLDAEYLAQRHGLQPDIMSKWVPWREAESLAELVEMTQSYQIELNRFYIDRLRYHKYRPTGGIAPFMFCDPYPAILWSIIDYWRVPKQSYYAMRTAFSPQYVFTLIKPRMYRVEEQIDLPLYVVNDAQEAFPHMQIKAVLYSPQGQQLATVEHALRLEADCPAEEVDRLRLTPTRPGRYTLELALYGGLEEVRQVYEVFVE
jgi:beta-mannosidase